MKPKTKNLKTGSSLVNLRTAERSKTLGHQDPQIPFIGSWCTYPRPLTLPELGSLCTTLKSLQLGWKGQGVDTQGAQGVIGKKIKHLKASGLQVWATLKELWATLRYIGP